MLTFSKDIFLKTLHFNGFSGSGIEIPHFSCKTLNFCHVNMNFILSTVLPVDFYFLNGVPTVYILKLCNFFHDNLRFRWLKNEWYIGLMESEEKMKVSIYFLIFRKNRKIWQTLLATYHHFHRFCENDMPFENFSVFHFL